MIRITVELVPFGIEERAHVIAKGTIANDGTGTHNHGNYVCELRSAKRGNRLMGRGMVAGFPRKRLNVWHLIKLCLQETLS